MEFSCPGLVVKQPGFYVVLPIFPDPDPHNPSSGEPARVLPKTMSWNGFLQAKPPSTIWFDKGDQINFSTITRYMDRVTGTIVRVQKL